MEILIGLIVAAVFLFIAISRKSSSTLESTPQRSESVLTNKSTQDVIKSITLFASSNGYKVSHFDPEQGQLVLEEGLSMSSYGFFFPIRVIANGSNGSMVQIGIKSRAFQVGPVVGRSLDKVVAGVKAALY